MAFAGAKSRSEKKRHSFCLCFCCFGVSLVLFDLKMSGRLVMVVSAPLGLDSGQGYVLHPHNFKQHTFRDN